MSSARWVVGIVLGAIMLAIGAYIAVRPLWTHNSTVTGGRWLDMAFAAVFMRRGVLNIRTNLSRRRDQLAQG